MIFNPFSQWLSNIGGGFGVQPADSANNAISGMTYDEFMTALNEYNSRLTSSQREINQDFFNQQKEFNANQANIERAWQEKMSNSAYQRLVKDLEKAGLNKLLAYNNNPSGISSVGSASVGLPSSARGSDISSAFASMSNNNANRVNGVLGSIWQIVGGFITGISSIVSAIGGRR